MKKRIDPNAIALAIQIGLIKIESDLPAQFKKFPGDPNGVEIDYGDFLQAFEKLRDFGLELVEGLIGQLPEVEVQDPEPDEAEEPEKTEFNTVEKFNLRQLERNNKRFTWLPVSGKSYGGEIKFVFPESGHEMVVPDAAITHGADGNPKNYNQMFYFCGTDFPPESHENLNNRSSIFGPPGVPATVVELHYNR